jgi:PTH1 family peptidyl-tRNA hydrolase
VQSVIGAVGGKDFERLQLGIGRPNSRDPEAVSNYVLQNFTKAERGGL